MELPNGEKVLLTDTVGFIRKLPHNLIEAFKSTLEEAKYADIIVHVVDVSNPNYEQQMSTVYATLKQLGVEGSLLLHYLINVMFYRRSRQLRIYMQTIHTIYLL